MAVSLVSTGVTFPDSSTQTTAATGFGFKNRIINGAMVIDQRNAGASVTPTTSAFTVDRWKAELTQSSKFSVQQKNGVDSSASNYEANSTPDGFINSLKVTSLSAYSVTSTDQFDIRQAIEGFNSADLMWGTANAKTVTVSFWVKSSLTGTFGASLSNAANANLYNFNYTISSANTWEYKTATITGPTTGTWQTTTSAGIFLRFNLGLGATYGSTTVGSWVSGTDLVGNPSATSVVGTNGATFYITGVQLEKGSTATSFDYRPYGTELALCQRYFESSNISGNLEWLVGAYVNNTEIDFSYVYQVPKRAAPTVAIASANWAVYAASAFRTVTSSSVNTTGINNVGLYVITSGTTLSGNAGQVRNTAANAITISSEL